MRLSSSRLLGPNLGSLACHAEVMRRRHVAGRVVQVLKRRIVGGQGRRPLLLLLMVVLLVLHEQHLLLYVRFRLRLHFVRDELNQLRWA